VHEGNVIGKGKSKSSFLSPSTNWYGYKDSWDNKQKSKPSTLSSAWKKKEENKEDIKERKRYGWNLAVSKVEEAYEDDITKTMISFNWGGKWEKI